MMRIQDMYGKDVPTEPNAKAEYMEALQNIQKTQMSVFEFGGLFILFRN